MRLILLLGVVISLSLQSVAGDKTMASSIRYIAIKPYIFRQADGSGGVDVSKLQSQLAYTNTLFAGAHIQFYFLDSQFIDGGPYYDFEQSTEQDALFTNYNVANTISLYIINEFTENNFCFSSRTNSSLGIRAVILDKDCVAGDLLGDDLAQGLGFLFSLDWTHGTSNTTLTDELVDGSNCTTAGDQVCDTPASPNLSGLVDTQCNYTGTATDANGDPFDPLVNNIMSFSRSICTDSFTPGQLSKMESYASGTLTDLEDSVVNGLASFKVADRAFLFAGDQIQFMDQSVNAQSWSWSFEGGSPATSSEQNPLVTYASPGQYEVSLTIVDDQSTSHTLVFSNYITIDPIDITHYSPEGWDEPVRFYKLDQDGETRLYASDFEAGDDIYLEYGIQNDGINNALDSTFAVEVFVNDSFKWRNTWTLSVKGKSNTGTPRLGLLPPGDNEVRLEFDADDDYPEYDESNNVYLTTLSVSEPDIIDPSPISPILGVEYFFDTAVGFGEGTFISAAGTSTDEAIETIIPVNNLSSGLHALYIRAFNQTGRWGQTYKRNVYVTPTDNLSIKQSEYYFDQDPGYGNASPITLIEGETNHVIDLSVVSNGYHRLFIRTQNNMGRWSITNHISFVKVGQKLDPAITKLTYRYYDYETAAYGTEYSYPFDPPVTGSEEILLLDNSELVSGKQYAVVVYAYDENGKRSRMAYENFTYNEVVLISIDEVEVTDLVCYGSSTGQLTITASGGSGQLEYSIDGMQFQSDPVFDSLSSGDYTIYVRGDVENYVETTEVNISQPEELVLTSLESVNPSCTSTMDGEVTLSVSGGVSPYQFGLDNQLQESNTFGNLSVGNEQFKVIDANGCEASITLSLTPQEQLSIPSLQVIESTGQLSVSSLFESYQWYHDGEVISAATDSLYLVADFGTYSVQVVSESSCIYHSDTLQVEQLVVNEIKQIGVSCDGVQDGAIRVDAVGGYGARTYSLDGVNYQSSHRFYELAEGEQTLYIRSLLLGYVQEQTFTIGIEQEIDSLEESFDQRDPHKVINPDQDLTWDITSLAQHDGEYSLLMNFWSYETKGARDYYILPGEVSGTNRKLLDFHYAYTGYSGDITATDSLAIAQSFDCGATWEVIKQIGGEQLQTANPINDYFVPAESEWDAINIRIDTSFSDYLLAFIGINQFGNLLYLDQIELSTYSNNSPVLDPIEFSIEENSMDGSLVGTVTAEDADLDSFQFEILAGNSLGVFELNATSGDLLVLDSAGLDYEAQDVFELQVRVSDNYGGADTSWINIMVLDVDDNRAPILENQSLTLPENSISGSSVGTVIATDPEEDAINFSILSGNTNDAFALDSSTGELTVSNSSVLDFETNPSFILQVQVSDENGETATTSVTIALENIDETALIEATYSIAESAPDNTVIGSVGYFEQGTEQFPYFETTLIDQNDESFVKGVELINAGALEFDAETFDMVLLSSELLDFEEFTSFKVQVALCCYNAGSAPMEIITVNVSNVNEETSIVDQSFTIDENSAQGSLVGTVLANDEDGDALNYTILSGNTNDAFALDSSTGELTVSNSPVLDFETNPSLILQVQVSDGNGETATASVTVDLENIDETSLIEATYSIAESAPDNTVIGSVGYFEQGTEQFPYFETTLIDQNDEAFIKGVELINAGVLEFDAETFDMVLLSSELLDFEEFTSFKVQVALCCYNAGSAPMEIITVNVTNVNEETSIVDQSFTIDENSAQGSLVGTILANDEDGDALNYTILSGNTDDAYSLDETSGELSVLTSSALDFETHPLFELEVQVEDGNGGMATGLITIELVDLDETVLYSENWNNILVYPNPVQDMLEVQVPENLLGTKVYLKDLLGRSVEEVTVAQKTTIILIEHLPGGIYLLHIGEEIFKISKQ